MGVAMLKYNLPVCGFLNLSINQVVITANSLQNTIYNWSGMVNLHVLKKKCFKDPLKVQLNRQT